jgi:hypothetical protein
MQSVLDFQLSASDAAGGSQNRYRDVRKSDVVLPVANVLFWLKAVVSGGCQLRPLLP